MLAQAACIYLAVHPAQSALLNDEVTGRLQEVRAEVTLLDVVVLIAAVSGPGPGSDGQRDMLSVSHFLPSKAILVLHFSLVSQLAFLISVQF